MIMSYYEPQGWQAPAARQVSWEQPVPPSRSGSFPIRSYTQTHTLIVPGSSSVSQREEMPAFSSQFDGMSDIYFFFLFPVAAWQCGGTTGEYLTDSDCTEVDRAIDNLVKSGKLWAAPRRDSMPLMMGRPYPDYGMLYSTFILNSNALSNLYRCSPRQRHGPTSPLHRRVRRLPHSPQPPTPRFLRLPAFPGSSQ